MRTPDHSTQGLLTDEGPQVTPRLALAGAGALFAGIAALMLVSGHAADAPGNLSVLPIALLAWAFGRRGGLAGALIAFALLAGSDALDAQALSPLGYATRGVAYVVLGGTLGWMIDRLRGRVEVTEGLLRAQDAIGEGVLLLDPATGVVRGGTPAAGRLFGRPAAELAGARLDALVDEGERPRLAERLRLRCAGHPLPSRYETVARHPGGATVELEGVCGMVEMGGERLLVTLLRDASPAAAPAPTAPTAPGGSAVRVFLCDDVPDLRALLRAYLEADGGFAVVGEAGDGRGLPAAVRAAGADVILLDLSMPGVDGLEAIGALRAADPRLGIVVLSGFERERMAAQTLALGADRYLEKRAGMAAVRETVLAVAHGRGPA